MFRASFLVVLILGTVLQLSFAATAAHHDIPGLNNEGSLNRMHVFTQAMDGQHCDNDRQLDSQECQCCPEGSIEKCSMDVECHSINPPVVVSTLTAEKKAFCYSEHPPLLKSDIARLSFDIFHPPKHI